jgi:hypothetical protein
MSALYAKPADLPGDVAEGDALIERLRVLPEADAVRCYASLSARWQWFVRQRLTGVRRTALIVHHATAIAGCK